MLFLLSTPKGEWYKSQRQAVYGQENTTRFQVTARLDDGHIVWRGWFDDYDDFDQFLWAIANETLHQDSYVQRLPTPWWNPDLWYSSVTYSFADVTFLTTTNAANQTHTVASNWNSANNFIDVIASGGSGPAGIGSGANQYSVTGAGGAGWSRQTNVTLTPGGSATYRLNVGAPGVTSPGAAVAITAGNTGGDAWYNGTTLAGSSVGAKGGGAGQSVVAVGTATGAVGGAAASGIGSSKNSGGASGSAQNTGVGSAGSGAGGAAGSNGAGNASANSIDTGTNPTDGGSGDAGFGGAGGSFGVGGNGTEYDATHGSGGGGGGGTSQNNGGLYGAGGNGTSRNGVVNTSGSGAQALIVLSNTPKSTVRFRQATRFFTRKF